jgi:hypothetical protein
MDGQLIETIRQVLAPGDDFMLAVLQVELETLKIAKTHFLDSHPALSL